METSLGNRLNELRAARKVTIAQWSIDSGVPEGTIKSITSGNTASPGFETVCALLHALGVSADEFYCGVPIAASQPSTAPQEHASTAALIGDMKLIAAEAYRQVSENEVVKSLRKDRTFWRIVSIMLLAIILYWLQWDIRHPTVGIIQYETSANGQHQYYDDIGLPDDEVITAGIDA